MNGCSLVLIKDGHKYVFVYAPRERKALVDKALALAKSMKRNRRRWRRMRAPALRCLQLLTGLKLNSVDLFAEWWKVAKDSKEPFGSD